MGYGQDLEGVREVLDAVASSEPRILEDPKPVFVAQEFEADGVLIKFSVWARREIYLEIRSTLQIAVRREFDARKIAVLGSRMILDGGRMEADGIEAGRTNADGTDAGDAPAGTEALRLLAFARRERVAKALPQGAPLAPGFFSAHGDDHRRRVVMTA